MSAESDSMWNLRTLAECVLDAPQDRGINVGLARDLARAALDADAQLDLTQRSMQAAGTWDRFCKDYAALKVGRSVLSGRAP